MKRDWGIYYKKHLNRKPRKQLVRAFSLCSKKEYALDLGAGTLIESKFLIESGFRKVTAVDNSVEAESFADKLDSPYLDLKRVSFKKFKFTKNKYDLITAQFSLPFYGRRGFSNFLKRIKGSLRPDGIFVGQLFGVRDSWNIFGSDLVFNPRKEVEAFFRDMDILELIEEEKDGRTASGKKKHWHLFHFMVKK
jgi:SAM-dependent methyltransferase